PVARGAARPLLEPSRDARHVHGEDGMGDLGWPDAAADVDPRHAVELLRDLLLPLADAPEEERVTLVTLAPLTNIALLLRTWPEAAAGLRRIVAMGGTAGTGNATASAEFNVWHDPEAAAVVLDATGEGGVPVTMYGLDVFYDVLVDRAQAAELVADGRRTGNRSAELAGLLVEYQCTRFAAERATIGDAGAVCAVVDPGGLQTTRLPVRVELSGTFARGCTIVDRRDWSGDLAHDPHGVAPCAVDVALEVDGKRYADLWLGALRSPSPRAAGATAAAGGDAAATSGREGA
ncbi:MAG TPA: nucleoside hydrolase, partial [Segeticoccus sp.]|nr:nucleoside hydrolase [Segeticoccus sp.]